jgi:predicted aldo/keto reductase-like oxidoreductase
MEPVKGGTLADPPASVRKILEAADPVASMASWAIRYVASLPGILTVLSGMSNVEQMADNLSYMKKEAFHPLDEAEQETIRRAQAALASIPSIPCTGCNYCAPGCPVNIPIPDIFEARNKQMVYGKMEEGQRSYDWDTKEKGKASDCIACGQCEGACPQRINIIERLRDCASVFE